MQLFKANPNSSFKYNCLQYLIFFIFVGSEAAVSFIFYFLYPNENCSNSDIFPVQYWLLGNAIFFSFLLILGLSVFGDKYKFFAIVYDTMLILELLFSITWSVLGAIILFRDSSNCLETNGSLWIFTLFSLIFYWINIIFLIWTLIIKIKKK